MSLACHLSGNLYFANHLAESSHLEVMRADGTFRGILYKTLTERPHQLAVNPKLRCVVHKLYPTLFSVIDPLTLRCYMCHCLHGYVESAGFFTISHHLSVFGLRPSSSLSTGCVVSLRRDWAIFCHASSGGLADCDEPGKNPLKYSAVAGNWTRATVRTDSELSRWAIMTDCWVRYLFLPATA